MPADVEAVELALGPGEAEPEDEVVADADEVALAVAERVRAPELVSADEALGLPDSVPVGVDPAEAVGEPEAQTASLAAVQGVAAPHSPQDLHGVHAAAAPREKAPGGHAVQVAGAAAPNTSLYAPDPHDVHTAVPSATALYAPWGHAVQLKGVVAVNSVE